MKEVFQRRLVVMLQLLLVASQASAQLPSGSVSGMITDPSGAVVTGAEIRIHSPSTGLTSTTRTSKAGIYRTSQLPPGLYELQVSVPGFRPVRASLTISVGRDARLDLRLQVGPTAETISVSSEDQRVDTSGAALEGIVTESLIRNLPLNGRNFLDLGQLEPGVQLNPAEWPTRTGYVRLAFAGQSGVTTRVTVDGVDVSDENFGSVTANVSTDAIEEFQVSRSNLDASTGLTGSGAVNAVTRSGSNQWHGTGFLFWRNAVMAARVGEEDAPFERKQYGSALGGPVLRERLFWFANYERNRQDAAVETNFAPFPQFNATWSVPYDERMTLGRTDWHATPRLRLFFRFMHHWNQASDENGGLRISPMATVNQTNQSAVGLDAMVGRFTHAVRFGYTNYDNTSDLALGRISGQPLIKDSRGRLIRVTFSTGGAIGPNTNAPVRRYQDSHEARYDGGLSLNHHMLRWGTLVNFINLNWFASINSAAPNFTIQTTPANVAVCGSDLWCYPVQGAAIGNGMGYWTDQPSHGLPYGGIRNARLHWYAANQWRIHPRFTVSLGLRWVYEPGPANPDVSKPVAFLEQFQSGLGRSNRRDLNNFAPQLGLAWDPTGSGKWAVRVGAGVFYDINLLKHVIFERHVFLPPGVTNENLNLFNRPARDPVTDAVIFSITPFVTANCAAGKFPGRCQLGTPNFVETVWNGMEAFQSAYLTASSSSLSGLTRAERGRGVAALGAFFDPDYATPYSVHLNLGIQRELRPGLVISADYVRNRSLKFLLRHDLNRVGAADTLDVSRAAAAMNAVHAAVRPTPCPPGPAGVSCAISAGVTFSTYLNRGLGSSTSGATLTSTNPSAFAGMNPAYNRMEQLETAGISTYDALHLNIRGRVPSVRRFVRDGYIIGSYSWSRLEAIGFEDQALYNSADQLFNDDPRAFRGPADLDRTHMLTVSGLFTTFGGVRLNSIWRRFSALPQSVFVPSTGSASGEIFFTDFNGDGFGGDPLPGTSRGAYGRSLGCGSRNLNRVIDDYNVSQAGHLTPAGRALVNAGLFTTAQMTTLGAVSPPVARAPETQLCLDAFIATDLRVSRPFKLSERITVEPALEWFNLFNVANTDLPGSKLSSPLSATVGSINGTPAGSNPFRAGSTDGSFALGAPRSWQLSVRVSF